MGNINAPIFLSLKIKTSFFLQKGPVEHDVFDRELVIKDPKAEDILREAGLYHKDTDVKRFSGNVLGYITPVNIYFLLSVINKTSNKTKNLYNFILYSGMVTDMRWLNFLIKSSQFFLQYG